MTGTLNNRLIGYRSHIYHTTQSLSEPTWLDTAWPYRTNVAKCSLLKFIRSYLNSWCRKVSQQLLIVSCGDGTRLYLLLTLMQVPGGTLISVMCCVQILVFFRTRSPFDFGTICWTKLRQAFCAVFSSWYYREIKKESDKRDDISVK